MESLGIFKESAITYLKRIANYVYAVINYSIASAVMSGALIGVWMLAFIAFLLLGAVKTIGPFVLLPLGAVIMILIFYFLTAFRGGFIASCYDIYEGRSVSPVLFTDYSLRRGGTFFIVQFIALIAVAIVALPLLAINAFFLNMGLAAVSSIIVAVAMFAVGAVFIFVVPAAVVDNVGAGTALARGIKTAMANIVDFAVFAVFFGILYAVVFMIPLVGWLLCIIIIMPIADTAAVMFYRSRKRV